MERFKSIKIILLLEDIRGEDIWGHHTYFLLDF